METSLIISSENEIQALENHPVTAYLSGLANKNAQRVQRQALEVIANMLIGSSDILACNWSEIRYSHCQAIRSKIAQIYSASSANRMLSALRGY